MGQAGTAVFTIGGNLIGSYLGGPVGGAIGGLAGGLIGSALFNRTKKPLIPDLNLMNSSYGNPIALLWGTALLPGVIIWMTPVQVVDNGSGKGGPSAKSNAPSVYQSAGIAFLEIIRGKPAQMAQLFLNGKLFVDQLAGSVLGQAIEAATGAFAIRQYHGDEAQLPDYIYTQWCATNVTPPTAVPANRGLAYLVFDRINIERYGQVFPQTTAIWSTNTETTTNTASFTASQVLGSLTPTPSFYGNMAVDWTRGYVYTLTDNSVLTQFSIATGRQVAQRSFASQLSVDMPGASIYVGEGTNLYLFGANPSDNAVMFKVSAIGLNSDTGTQITQIDPVTLTGSPLFGRYQPGPSVIVSLRSSSGVTEAIVGTLAPQGGNGFLINTNSGLITFFPLQFGDFFDMAVVCLGNQSSDGTQDVWILQWDRLDSSQSLYLFKVQVTPSLLSSSDLITLGASLTAVFTPAMFGLPSLGSGAAGTIAYDRSRDGLIIQPQGWSPGVGVFEWTTSSGILWTSPASVLAGNAIVDSGTIGGISSGVGVLVSTNNGAVSLSTLAAGSPPPTFTGQTFFNSAGNVLVYGNSDGGGAGGTRIYMARLQQVSAVQHPVADIITDICAFGGLTPADIDVSLVTATTTGYVIRDHKSVGAALADLCHVFVLDIVESNFKLKFVPRGLPAVLTITQSQLASIDANDPSRYWIPRRTQELELPLLLDVKYEDNELQDQIGGAYARRTALPWPTVRSKRRLVMDLPVVANNTEARAFAERLLYTMWQERSTYSTMLGPRHLELDAGDNVGVTLDNGTQYFVRIEDQELSPNLMQRPTFCAENVATYVPAGTPGAVTGFVPQTITPAVFGALLQFNVPLLQDSDALTTATRIYAAAGSQGASWTGGGLFTSPDNVNWTLLKVVGPAAIFGYATTVLGDTLAKFALDKVSKVTVTLAAGETPPLSCTYAEMMNGANAALLGSEIIQFQNVTENTDGTVTLDTLTRGNRGTEWATGLHVVNDLFLILTAGNIIGAQLPLGDIGVTEFFELLPTGAFLDQGQSVGFKYLGYDLKPYAPVGFTRTPSGSDLRFDWIRRTRVGGDLIDGTDTVPLSEDSELYEAYLLASPAALAAFDPLNGATYKRAWTGLTSPSALYTAAEMATDSFTPATDQAPLVVYQVSAVVGRGFQGYALMAAF